ncbi:glycoside hydrolase family 172 protein [Bifidobacterium saguinibicoloris]|uniref:glycoside hydrolase family 172 protein n=1 Tax=Bifidobacterium saguinibicoloris TaxID=2834433 RepID=UPI001C5A3BC5|nr:DUF2961 domain-containing protein [Bifidobacterium saguinibicoloris]
MTMTTPYQGNLTVLPMLCDEVTRSINAENPHGLPGGACHEAGPLGPSRKGRPCLTDVAPGASVTLADIEGPGCIRHMWFTVTDRTDDANRYVLRDLVLAIYWDDEDEPSVECPLGDFFCCGFGRSCDVTSMPITVAPTRGMNCYFAMPFRRRARIVVRNGHPNPIPALFYQIDYALGEAYADPSLAYFHAQWRRQPVTETAHDYVILDGVEGRGQYVGTYLAISTLQRYWWGEGEIKFYIDGDGEYPTACSTGTEDYFGGAWSFAGVRDGRAVERTFCAPYFGYPFHATHDDGVFNPYHDDSCPPMRGLYRWHIPDPVRFREGLRVTLQQIGSGYEGAFERQDDVSSVAYWYQSEPHAPFPPLPEGRARHPR